MDPIILGIAAYLLTLGKGKKTADRLEYFPKNVEMLSGKLYFVMDILNPTKNPLKVDSFFGGAFVDDKRVGSIERGTPFIAAPNTRTQVKFPIKLDPLSAASLLLSIIQGKFKKQFKIAGIARALGLDNPVSKEVNLA